MATLKTEPTGMIMQPGRIDAGFCAGLFSFAVGANWRICTYPALIMGGLD
jgi:hypothetical protein